MLKICLLLLLPFTGSASQKDTVIREHYNRVQFAGNTGLISYGRGRQIRDWLTADLNFGYLPKHVNGVRVFTFSLRPSIRLKSFGLGQGNGAIYTGSGFNYSFGRKIYGKIPDYYPFDYYWPNAFHFTPYAGIRYGPGKRGRLLLFSELGTVDYKIWFASKNREVNIFEIWDLNFGIIFKRGMKTE